jgi:hypothetical protein
MNESEETSDPLLIRFLIEPPEGTEFDDRRELRGLDPSLRRPPPLRRRQVEKFLFAH